MPLACVAYYPVLAILKRPDPLGAPDWLLPLAPVAGFAFLALSFDDVKNLSQIWAVAPALVKLALRDDRRSQIDKEPPWKRIAKGLI
jgi:hypothetical protein